MAHANDNSSYEIEDCMRDVKAACAACTALELASEDQRVTYTAELLGNVSGTLMRAARFLDRMLVEQDIEAGINTDWE